MDESAQEPSLMVRPSGRLDEDACGDLRCQLAAAFAAGVTRVVVDLSEVTGLDQVGLGVLSGASRHLARKGGALVVHRAPAPLVTVLRVNGLGHLLELGGQPLPKAPAATLSQGQPQAEAQAQGQAALRLVGKAVPAPERRLSVVRGVSGT